MKRTKCVQSWTIGFHGEMRGKKNTEVDNLHRHMFCNLLCLASADASKMDFMPAGSLSSAVINYRVSAWSSYDLQLGSVLSTLERFLRLYAVDNAGSIENQYDQTASGTWCSCKCPWKVLQPGNSKLDSSTMKAKKSSRHCERSSWAEFCFIFQTCLWHLPRDHLYDLFARLQVKGSFLFGHHRTHVMCRRSGNRLQRGLLIEQSCGLCLILGLWFAWIWGEVLVPLFLCERRFTQDLCILVYVCIICTHGLEISPVKQGAKAEELTFLDSARLMQTSAKCIYAISIVL